MKYVACCKLKQNELFAISELDEELLDEMTPLFDLPKPKEANEREIEERMRIGLELLEKRFPKNKRFYIDVYDLPSGIELAGVPLYASLLNRLDSFRAMPVIGLDRDPQHINDTLAFLANSEEQSVALRVTRDEIESFALVEDELVGLVEKFNAYKCDLICDLRTIFGADFTTQAQKTHEFITEFKRRVEFSNIVLVGSSLTPIISDYAETNKYSIVLRKELKVYQELCKHRNDVVFGDYGVVSPDYSDVDIPVELLQNFMAPKVLYTDGELTHVFRGGAFRTHPRQRMQYFDIAKSIVGTTIYHGVDYSNGDSFIYEKSEEIGSPSSPGRWLRATTNAHFTYVLNGLL